MNKELEQQAQEAIACYKCGKKASTIISGVAEVADPTKYMHICNPCYDAIEPMKEQAPS